MWDKLKQIKIEAQRWVRWAEEHLKDKSGEQKKEIVLNLLLEKCDIPWVPKFIEKIIYGVVIDSVCRFFNWFTDWDFANVELSEEQMGKIADVLDAPDRVMAKAAIAGPGMSLDERLEQLYVNYKIVTDPEPNEWSKYPPHMSEEEVQEDENRIQDNYDRSITFSLKWEGGKNYTRKGDEYTLKNKADKGGPTNMGITLPTLAAAFSSGLVKSADLDDLTREDVEKIYKVNYWDRHGWGDLAWPVCLCALDCSINHGGFAWILQRACVALGSRVDVDGKYGPRTRAAMISQADHNPAELAQKIVDERKKYYDNLIAKDPGQKANLKGWYNRLRGMAETAGVKSPV